MCRFVCGMGDRLKELALFAGAGGSLLAGKRLGFRCVGAVEIDDYCQRVIAARQEDGHLEQFPIFGCIRAFLDQGYARAYRGMVDVVTAGFPCQPHSLAGKRQGAMDERDLWPDTCRVISEVDPLWVMLENVPGLAMGDEPYLWRVLRDLSYLGFDARWGVLSAAEVGARHLRKRLWIAANAVSAGLEIGASEPGDDEQEQPTTQRGSRDDADAAVNRRKQRRAKSTRVKG